MNIGIRTMSLGMTIAAVAGCVEEERLSDNSGPPAGMEQRCIGQVAAQTGVAASAVALASRIGSGRGPLISLEVAGQTLGCQRKADGSVTVFSEYAN